MSIDVGFRLTQRLMVDTSVLIAHLRGKGNGEMLMNWASAAGRPYISCLSILEVAQGMNRQEEEATRALLEAMEAVPVTQDIAWNAGVLLRDLRQQGVTIHLPDALIAVSARTTGVPLLTHNTRHFQVVPDLSVIDAREVTAS